MRGLLPALLGIVLLVSVGARADRTRPDVDLTKKTCHQGAGLCLRYPTTWFESSQFANALSLTNYEASKGPGSHGWVKIDATSGRASSAAEVREHFDQLVASHPRTSKRARWKGRPALRIHYDETVEPPGCAGPRCPNMPPQLVRRILFVVAFGRTITNVLATASTPVDDNTLTEIKVIQESVALAP